MVSTDDDVILDFRWLEAYTTAFRRWPAAVLFGAGIIARFETAAPRWIERNKKPLSIAFTVGGLGSVAWSPSMAQDR
jgi:hypothetical protein